MRARFAALAARAAAGRRAVDRVAEAGSGWPRTSTENLVREIALPSGLVDNKVCAIDDTWSGLRFVWRLRDRPSHT